MKCSELARELLREDPEAEVCVEAGHGGVTRSLLLIRAQEGSGKVLILVDANCRELPDGWEIVTGEVERPERQPWERVVC